ncbi:MAG: PTS sugar transporter subunit IIA [Spirochaetota bacterium]|nr:PTS sugar transporter subunit IIA [Spirochaetota bacterium]
MKPIVKFTDQKYIKRIKSRDKYKAIAELAHVFSDSNICSNIDELIRALHEREEIMSTGIGFGIAIPHAKIKSVNEITFAIGISKHGIDFDSIDKKPVHLLVLVAAGERQHKDYLKLLSNIMAKLKNQRIKQRIINSNSNKEIINILSEED